MHARTTAAALLSAAALAGIAGCGGEQSPPPPADHQQHRTEQPAPQQGEQAVHNQADIAFAEGMIPHHQQALRMADMVPERTGNAEVLDLAERIRAAQQPEIDQLEGWLAEWRPAPPQGHQMPQEHSMPEHGGHEGMHGMMTPEDMAALEQARGAEFDRMWLEMMIEHHEGAVQMAETELAEGANPEAKAMAQRIIDSQQAEIDEMNALLR
ncbi:DUF305 domain-containing protein [Saccharopolyspora cebuensis]|uniref:DUF305 domain-containing protein n=1 Tax=Saccharopolyspora cebuensis TaxID=418759 RepID=A0ABV4CMQ7_9PSEU